MRIGQRLTDNTFRELHRQAADVGAQSVVGLIPFVAKMQFGRPADALRFRLGFLARVGNDLLALGPRLLAQRGGLLAGLGKLLLVMPLGLFGLLLDHLGTVDAALDRIGPLVEHLLELGDRDLLHTHRDDDRQDQADDEFFQMLRSQRTQGELHGYQSHTDHGGPNHWMTKASTKPRMARASTTAKPM